jgi:hypothetical protein
MRNPFAPQPMPTNPTSSSSGSAARRQMADRNDRYRKQQLAEEQAEEQAETARGFSMQELCAMAHGSRCRQCPR